MFSYSRVSCFKQCPFLYFLRYIKKYTTTKSQDADNPLYLGSAIHLGLEKDVEEARKQYFNEFYLISDQQINEFIKIEELLPRVKKLLPEGVNEVEIKTEDFIGYIDRLVKTGDNTYDIYDYKYSNNVDNYMKSAQLHLYKYYFELTHPNCVVNNLYYVFIPKILIRQKKTECLYQFRRRLIEELEKAEIKIERVEYDQSKVDEFLRDCKDLSTCEEFNKQPTKLCNWCEFKDFCESNGEINYNIIIND